MPVADLLAIRDLDDLVEEVDDDLALWQASVMEIQGVSVPVFDLSSFLQLSAAAPSEEKRCLVFSGAECPWAFVVDRVDGVFEKAAFDYKALPAHLLEERNAPYHSVAIRNGEPLVNFEPDLLGRQLLGAGDATGPV